MKEFITPEGFRTDGRYLNTLRPIQVALGVNISVDGSARFKMGRTEVTADVLGPFDANRSDKNSNISVDTVMAPFATPFRSEANHKRLTHISIAVQNMCCNLIRWNKYPQSEIIVNLVVLCNDGSLTAACLNAAFLALIDANMQLKESIYAVTVGFLGDKILHDISFEEGSAVDEMVIAMGTSSKKMYALMYSSRCRMEEQMLLLTQAEKSIGDMMRIMRSTIINSIPQDCLQSN